MSNRQERRANPDQWWKLVGYFDESTKAKVHGLKDEYAQYVKGSIDRVIVVALPSDIPISQRAALMEGMRQSARLAGNEHEYLVVPDSVKFLRVQPADRETARRLDVLYRNRRIDAQVSAAKAEAAEKARNPGSEEPS